MTKESCSGMPDITQGVSEFVERLARLNREFMLIGLRSAQPWFDAYNHFFTSAMRAAGGACRIPETACPPYCACTLAWTVVPGDARVGHIKITNTSKQAITYSLVATPLSTCGEQTEQRPRLEPAGGTVAPGESLAVRVSVEAEKSWRPGATYESEIKIRGLYERCACVRLQVAADAEPCCKVEMGEIPKRVRSDDWYRHYQCTELCFEPITRGQNEPADDPNRPR